MAKNERAEQTTEKLIAQLISHNPDWKRATTAEEIVARALRGRSEIFIRKAHHLNEQWNLFYYYPEMCLFEDVRQSLRQAYNALSARKRQDNYDAALEKMATLARDLYKDIIVWPDIFTTYNMTTQKFNDSFIKKQNSTEEKTTSTQKKPQGLVKQKGERYSLKKESLKKFANDTTPVEKLVPNQDGANKFLEFLKSNDILTLGNYISKVQLPADRTKYLAIYGFCRRNNLLDLYTQFRQNIGKLINGQSAEQTKSTLFDDDAPLSTVQDNPKSKKSKSALPKREKDEDVYAWMNRLPCELFVKGSDSMKRIYAAWNDEKDSESKAYIETGFGDKDVNGWAEGETEHYKQIVDAKRKEIEIKEQERKERERKEQLGASVKKKLGEVEHYHHSPTLFKKMERQRFLRFDDDNLNV